MAIDEQYRRQAALLVEVLPLIEPEDCFALKGGTAINLFVRDMPRLSVDIDLTYLPIKDRRSSLRDIDAAMRRTAANIGGGIRGARVNSVVLSGDNCVNKLVVRANGVQIKVEVTPVLRGCVYGPEKRWVTPQVEVSTGFAEMQVVSHADLYAGKIVAALDRQHPRDLFDVRELLANEGIDDALRNAFVIYLVSHGRTMAEILDPTRREISEEFARGFSGMTEIPVTVEELVEARETLIVDIVGRMPRDHRNFLLSFKRGQPDWSLLGLPGAEDLPAVQWKLQNLAKLTKDKRAVLLERLSEVLSRAGCCARREERKLIVRRLL